ncbi:hypothetical protein Prudu_661S000700 [Prunus dulcis]|uniref:Reverse transcriptase Ty1/copia-type domain-containing protein n=1 Tax=Prunus dulcis TaxID=3755 RepID=A0A5H2XLL5_PRUDU|nr:hypothetical protein Prudu_661S000700 [Prunus dulcis]
MKFLDVSSFQCDTCELAKSHRVPFPLSSNKSLDSFSLIHFDIWGPAKIATLAGAQWFVTSWHHTSMPMPLHSPRKWVAERKNRHLLEVVRAFLFGANMPRSFWGEAYPKFSNTTSNTSPPYPNTSHPKRGTLDFRLKLIPESKSVFSLAMHLIRKDTGVIILLDVTLHQNYWSPAESNRSPSFSSSTIENLLQNDRSPTDSDRLPEENFQLSPCYQNQEEEIELVYEILPASAPVRHQSPTEEVIQAQSLHISLQKGRTVANLELSESRVDYVKQLADISVPNSVTKALEDPKWKEAMNEEMRALQKNVTWELVPLPYGKKTVGCMWIYTMKLKADGSVERYKAKLEETFAPVAKINTIRVLLSLAANLDWPLHQFDVKNAFLHGDLEEESNSDHTLFLKRDEGKLTALIVYVDDIIVTGNDDLGDLMYFLGIEAARSKTSIFSQRKYVMDLLTKRECLDYQRLVGRLIYLAHTRPIVHMLSVVSQFMHSPNVSHRNAIDRILRYLKSAPQKGSMFSKNGDLEVVGYIDVDWAGSISDRRSTSCYFTFVGGNLVT